jgi:hypothetical protein
MYAPPDGDFASLPPPRQIDDIDRCGKRGNFNVKRNPSCATSIHSGDKHQALTFAPLSEDRV